MTLELFIQWINDPKTGIAAVFAVLWWLERQERKEAQAELRDIAKDSTTAITKVEGAVGQLISVFKPGRHS